MSVSTPPRRIELELPVEVRNPVIVKDELWRKSLSRYPIDASGGRVKRMDRHSEPPDHFQIPTDAVADTERVDRAIGSKLDRPHRPRVRHDETRKRKIEDVRPAKQNLT